MLQVLLYVKSITYQRALMAISHSIYAPKHDLTSRTRPLNIRGLRTFFFFFFLDVLDLSLYGLLYGLLHGLLNG